MAAFLLLGGSSSASVRDVSIAVTESISPGTVAPGESATFSFSATNNGADVAQFYVVLFLGPGSWSVGSSSQTAGAPFSCSRPDNYDIVCTADPFAGGTSASFSVPVTLGSDAVPGQILDSRVIAFQGSPGGSGLASDSRSLVVGSPPAGGGGGGGGGGGALASTLSVALHGSGSGTVSSAPDGISCGSTCSGSYAQGTSVTLTATPAEGSIFTGWTDACAAAGTALQCALTLSADTAVGASFDPRPTTTTPPPVVCAVPRLLGLKLATAKARLLRSHCRLGGVTTRVSRTSLVGRVVAQRPAASAYRTAGARVSVVLGRRIS